MSGKLKCIVCDAEYDTCNCARDLNSWKKICCTSNHYQVYLVLNDYNFGKLTKRQAKTMLNRLDISDSDEWDTSSGKQIKEIYEASESKKSSRKRKSTKVE